MTILGKILWTRTQNRDSRKGRRRPPFSFVLISNYIIELTEILMRGGKQNTVNLIKEETSSLRESRYRGG